MRCRDPADVLHLIRFCACGDAAKPLKAPAISSISRFSLTPTQTSHLTAHCQIHWRALRDEESFRAVAISSTRRQQGWVGNARVQREPSASSIAFNDCLRQPTTQERQRTTSIRLSLDTPPTFFEPKPATQKRAQVRSRGTAQQEGGHSYSRCSIPSFRSSSVPQLALRLSRRWAT